MVDIMSVMVYIMQHRFWGAVAPKAPCGVETRMKGHYMCRESFNKVGQLVGEWVEEHGGILVIQDDKMRRQLRRWTHPSVKQSAIDHWVMPLRRLLLCREPYGGLDGVVVIYDTRKFPRGLEGVSVRKDQIDPEVRYLLNEERLLVSAPS